MTDGWDRASPFTRTLSPAVEHIDGLGHTNNAAYVQWCEQVAWAHSEALGLGLADYRRLDRAMAIREGHYDYLLPSYAGEALVLGTWLTASDGKLTMERRFQLRRETDGQTIVRGRWLLVCIDISAGRPRRMPPEFLAIYETAVVPAAG